METQTGNEVSMQTVCVRGKQHYRHSSGHSDFLRNLAACLCVWSPPPTWLTSQRKEERPRLTDSTVCILVNSLSVSGMRAAAAGTQQPTWARYTIRPTCFMYTLFPLELGPVTMWIRPPVVSPILRITRPPFWPNQLIKTEKMAAILANQLIKIEHMAAILINHLIKTKQMAAILTNQLIKQNK